MKIKIHKLITVLRNLDDAYQFYQNGTIVDERTLENKQEFDKFNFDWPVKAGDHSHPIYKIGSALELAKQYNVQLERGTCHGDCRAFIAREDWLNPIDTAACQPNLGVWTVLPWDEIDSIYGYGSNACTAIVRCLTFARRAGVI